MTRTFRSRVGYHSILASMHCGATQVRILPAQISFLLARSGKFLSAALEPSRIGQVSSCPRFSSRAELAARYVYVIVSLGVYGSSGHFTAAN
jgi:hypothetical protein